MNENKNFQYTYSAHQNKEVQDIRQKYLPKEENKLELLRHLDHTVNNAGLTEALLIGIFSCLIFGTGLCFIMKVIGNSIVPGILLGALGTAGMCAAYPVFRSVREKKKKELTPQILALTEELMNG